MSELVGLPFRQVWAVDFEFSAVSGERPAPICLVAWELRSGRRILVWEDELAAMREPPYDVGPDALFVAYYASAELGCHLALDWPMPAHVLDLFAEFRNLTNGLSVPCGNGLLGALAWFGLSSIESAEKDSMRALAIRGGPWKPAEKAALLAYCESDVESLSRLLPAALPSIDVPRAMLRGRYMKAAAGMEYNGIPLDTATLGSLREHWDAIQDGFIASIDPAYGIYEGRTFRQVRFANWLAEAGIPWPRLATGRLDLSDDAFRTMSKAYPSVAPLRELRHVLSQMRLAELAVGVDGRNRCLLSAFRARTGRNQPSNSRFIFGPSVWLRGLIRPEPGFGLAYIDWNQQEFGIAAALSRDPLMQEAYSSGDPYLAFAKQAGAVPDSATKQSHKSQREQFKACVLAVQYGMGPKSLAQQIGQPEIRARELLRLHAETYRQFWSWSDSALDYAMLHGRLWTVFGWECHVAESPNPRSLRNFLMQGNGSEMLRLACCLVTEAGVRVAAPVHDALLIEAPLDELDEAAALTQSLMSDASAVVLDGFRLGSEAEIIRYPDRYADERGAVMWETLEGILVQLSSCASAPTRPAQTCNVTCAGPLTRTISSLVGDL